MFGPISQSTATQYATTMAKLIWFTIRAMPTPDDGSYVVPLSEPQRAACARLLEVLASQDVAPPSPAASPPFPVSPPLGNQDDDDEEHLPPLSAAEELLVAFHGLLLSLVAESPSSPTTSPFWSPVIVFMVLACVTPKNDFVKANEISRLNAQLIYTIRSVLFKEILSRMENDKMAFYEYVFVSLLTPSTRSLPSSAYQSYSRFLVGAQQQTPMIYCANLAGLLAQARNAEEDMPRVQFKDLDRKIILFRNIEFSHMSISTVVRGVMHEYEALLQKLLLGASIGDFGFPIDIASLRDQPSNVEPGFSFLHDPRNKAVAFEHALLRYLVDGVLPDGNMDKAPPAMGTFHVVQGQRTYLKQSTVMEFLHTALAMEDYLITMLHLSMGQPARGEEIANFTICNVIGSDTRSLHIMHGMFCFVTSYHKTINQVQIFLCCIPFILLTVSFQTQIPKLITRAPPPDIAQLVLFHLAVVRPAQVTLARRFLPPGVVQRLQTYLFPGLHAPVRGEHISSVIAKHTRHYLNENIGLHDYRQLASALSRWNRRMDAGSIPEHPFEHQRGHSTATYNAHYGLSTDMLRRANPLSVVMDLAASTEWHYDLGLGPRYHPKGYELVLSDAAPHPARGDDPPQAVGENIAATVSEFLSRSLPAAVSANLKPTIDRGLQDILGYTATTSHTSSVTIAPSSVQQYRTSIQSLTALRKFLGKPDASFSSPLQGQALEAILARKTNLLVVLPTGHGKSLLIFLPAKMFEEDKTTVVVVPLRALHEDFKRRATQHGIRYNQWTPHQSIEACCVPLVFVSVEHAAVPQFSEFLSSLIAYGRLSRVVWDEAHLLLVHSSFRECLNHLAHSRSIPVPFVFLSATVAPSLEVPMLSKLNVRDVVVFRLPSTRPEISTFIATFESRRTLDNDLIRRFVEEVPGRRGIIFCRSVVHVKHVAELLQIPPFYADLEQSEKLSTLSRFMKGDAPAVVATSSLGEGIDISGITYVWHYGLPYDPASYVQQTGRMSRDGSFGQSIVFSLRRERLNVPPSDFLGTRIINSWMEERICRRIRLSEFLDGKAVECSVLLNPNLCDVCAQQATSSSHPPLETYPSPVETDLHSWEFPGHVDPDNVPCDINVPCHNEYVPLCVCLPSVIAQPGTYVFHVRRRSELTHSQLPCTPATQPRLSPPQTPYQSDIQARVSVLPARVVPAC